MTEKNIGYTQKKTEEILQQLSKVVIGQEEFIEQLLIVMLTGGHALVEGVPGVAKTLTAKTLARTVRAEFKRVQFTPDLMPADILGSRVFDIKNSTFYLKKGPLFTNIFLADEINRTPPKTQAALLEAMEEKSITIDGETHELAEPFMVLATQNPVEYEGTYPLPEAQLDRFMMKLVVSYVTQEQENEILTQYNLGRGSHKLEEAEIKPVFDREDLQKCREEIQTVEVDPGIVNYITSIAKATRNSPLLVLGASPRASIAMLTASKCYAAMQGRGYVTPEDVKDLALPILRHRIILQPEAGIDGMENDQVISSILNKVEVPR